jgi:hypothetical protein
MSSFSSTSPTVIAASPTEIKLWKKNLCDGGGDVD